MRLRMTVVDHATGLRSDVLVECGPADRTAAVLGAVATVLPVIGDPAVDGVPLDPAAPVARSSLAEGVLLRYGAAGPAPAALADGPLLRVISGASAGTELQLGLGMLVDVGRSSACTLVLDDPAVSRRHASLRCLADGAELTDHGSLAGVLVNGTAVDGRHRVRSGDIVQLGASRLVLQAPEHIRLPLRRTATGRFTVPWPAVTPLPPPADPGLRWPEPPRAFPPIRCRVVRRRAARLHAVQRVRAAVEQVADDEDTRLRIASPDPATLQRIALEPRAELWSRTHPVRVRLGTADRPTSVRVAGPAPAGWEPPVLRRAPVVVELDAVGALGIAGPGAWVADRLAWVILQCAVLHGPDALPILVLAPDAAEDEAGWVRWLPHLRAVAWDPADEAALTQVAQSGGPALVVLCGVTGQAAERMARMPWLRFVCTAPDVRRLPVHCPAVLAATTDGGELWVDGRAPVRLAPDVLAPDAADRVARRLAPLVRPGVAEGPAVHPLGAVPLGWSVSG